MIKEKINLEYIKKFNPCQSGVKRFIGAGYKDFNGSIIDFIELDKISFKAIKWVIFNKDQKILSDNLMREFALLCALRAVERVNIPEITHLYDIALLEYISGERSDSASRYSARSASRYSARSAAYYSAYYAADSAARYDEENIQKEILIDLIENGLIIKLESI